MNDYTDHVKRLQNGFYEGWTVLVREWPGQQTGWANQEVAVLRPGAGEYWVSMYWPSPQFPTHIRELIQTFHTIDGFAGMSLLEFLIRTLQD